MNAMLVYTASSCGVSESGISDTAPTVPWIVSSRVSPVNTRIVSCCSSAVSVFHDCTSFDSGTFSGSQKLLTRRFQTSTSLSSWILFQLIALTWSTSFSFPPVCAGSLLAEFTGSVRVMSVPSERMSRADVAGVGLQHAADAAVHFRALQRELAEADVVDRLDSLLPR